MQNNNFNNNSYSINYLYFLNTTTNVLGKTIFEDFIYGVRSREGQLLEKFKKLANKLESNELNSEQFKRDVTKKIEEMKTVFKKKSNFKDVALQETMYGLMQETTKILDDFEKKINDIESLQEQTTSQEQTNNNLNNNLDENLADVFNLNNVETIIAKPLNRDDDKHNKLNNIMKIKDLKDGLIIPKLNNIALNNNLNNKINLYLNGLQINEVKNLLEICDMYLEKFNEGYLKNLLKRYMAKLKKNKNKDITILCLFCNSKYITQYRKILKLMRKSSKLQNKNRFKHEQQKVRIIEYFYYILCATGFVNQHGRIIDEKASKDFESLMEFLERSF